MSKSVFLLGSCRILWVLQKDHDHSWSYGESRVSESRCAGYVYSIPFIYTLLQLFEKKTCPTIYQQYKPHIENGGFPSYTSNKFTKICESFEQSNLIVMEVASFKYYMLHGTQIPLEYSRNSDCKDVETHKLSSQELTEYMHKIIQQVHAMGKKILFVTPIYLDFHESRKQIFDIVDKLTTIHGVYVFHPSYIVDRDRPAYFEDPNHYSRYGEMIVMPHLTKKIQSILFESAAERPVLIS